MNIDPKRRGPLTGKIYKRMMQFLDEEGREVKPIDVVRWWSFWEAAVPPDLNPGRMFWAALVTTVRMRDDAKESTALFGALESWLAGNDYMSVEIVELGDEFESSPN
jgi:hypothetical protein